MTVTKRGNASMSALSTSVVSRMDGWVDGLLAPMVVVVVLCVCLTHLLYNVYVPNASQRRVRLPIVHPFRNNLSGEHTDTVLVSAPRCNPRVVLCIRYPAPTAVRRWPRARVADIPPVRTDPSRSRCIPDLDNSPRWRRSFRDCVYRRIRWTMLPVW